MQTGDAVFVDANTYLYCFGPHAAFGVACGQLIQRTENLELGGFTPLHVLAEVAHQSIIAEVASQMGWASGKVKLRLRKQPQVMQALTCSRTAMDTIFQSCVRVLTLGIAEFRDAEQLGRQCGLLMNDALTAAPMQAHGLTRIASADTDFDRVPGITCYGPA